MTQKNSLVSAAELDALIKGWGASPYHSVDKFFPLRFWYLFSITLAYCVWLLFWTDTAVQRMATDPSDTLRLWRFLYFRGWFIALILIAGLYAYFRNWYPGIVFAALFLLACVNLVFDLFNVYANVIAHPTPRTTLMLIARLVALWFVYLNIKNSSRLPEVRDRMNLLLPFKRDA